MMNRKKRRKPPGRKSSADRSSVYLEGHQPNKSVPQERAASPGTGLFNGGLGAVPPTSEAQVLIHLPCLLSLYKSPESAEIPVGINVSKGKDTVSVYGPDGEIVLILF